MEVLLTLKDHSCDETGDLSSIDTKSVYNKFSKLSPDVRFITKSAVMTMHRERNETNLLDQGESNLKGVQELQAIRGRDDKEIARLSLAVDWESE